MAKRKNRMAILKRQREQRKAEKAEMKRQRRLMRKEAAAGNSNGPDNEEALFPEEGMANSEEQERTPSLDEDALNRRDDPVRHG